MATIQFKGKSAVWNHHLSVPYHTLEEDKKKSLKGDNQSDNLIIQGDNLLALKSLLPMYQGKIKCIYIDPPYNTGNEGWIYNDKVNSPTIKDWIGKAVGKEGEDLTRHDKWLCMMTPRLKLLRELLAEDGAIFISIDENEVAGLKSICDEIFGEANLLSLFAVKVRHELRILKGDKDYHEVVEFLLAYKKSSSFKVVKKIVDNSTYDDYVYTVSELEKGKPGSQWGLKDCIVFRPEEFSIEKTDANANNLKKISIRGSIKEGNSSGRFYMRHLEPKRQLLTGHLIKVKNIGADGLGYRYFLVPGKENKVNGDYFQGLPINISDTKEVPYPTFLDFTDEFNTVGYEGDIDFQNGKKPIDFIQHLFKLCGLDNDSTVLDSFAGSGSTAQAVLDLNKEDGGNRKFILVEMEDYANKITAERVRRAIKNNDYKAGFRYSTLGPAIDAKSLLTGKLPTYQQFAKYVYYLATGKNLKDATKIKESASFVGKDDNETIYLLYEPNMDKLKQLAVTLNWAQETHKKDKGRKIVYAPACYLDEESMEQYNIEFVSIPYNLFERKA